MKTHFINPKLILLGVSAKDWEESIRIVGNILVKNGFTTNEYTEAMIRTVEELGPYIVIAPGIAIPHASSDFGVMRTGLAIIKLVKPISFPPNKKKVDILIGFCSKNRNSHINVLQRIAKILQKKENQIRLRRAESKEEILSIFRDDYAPDA